MSALAEGDAELVWMTHIDLSDKKVYILIVSSMESECQGMSLECQGGAGP